jgi:hypothetical protein
MANHHGSEGVIKSGTNAIAEVISFSITETAAFANDTILSDTATTTNATAVTSWSGSMEVNWDETDTNGQAGLTIGASVTIKVCPEGYASTDTYLTGTARITERSISTSPGEVVKATIAFQGSGALTTTTV